MRITIQYPPDYDGELHINCDDEGTQYHYSFSHAKVGDESKTLYRAAWGIVSQYLRERGVTTLGDFENLARKVVENRLSNESAREDSKVSI